MPRPLLALLLLAPPAMAQAPDPYRPAVEKLRAAVERERAAKGIPAVSVALVDDQRLVWAGGFGHADLAGTRPADAATAYRVGSVSKLFADVAAMRLVEQGKLDLDAPVSNYLPDFKPAYRPGDNPVTLRLLMGHRAGLVREPPVGHYFDPTHPTLAATAASVNGLAPTYPPGTRTKYSNAGLGVVGRVVEVATGERFEDAVKRLVLEPVGMTASAFERGPVADRVADGLMWTHHGRTFPAPVWEFGYPSAASLYAPVTDLGKFAMCLFRGGSPVLKPETLQAMYKPQAGPVGFGLGFSVRTFDGRRKVGHGGAVYGFATTFTALPDDKLAVLVAASKDVANGVTDRLADYALSLLLAAKAGKPLPDLPTSHRLLPGEARRLEGVYRDGERWLEVQASAGRAFLLRDTGGSRGEVRMRSLEIEDDSPSGGPRVLRDKKPGDKPPPPPPAGKVTITLTIDDPEGFGPPVIVEGNKLTLQGKTYTKEPPAAKPPANAPDRWKGLIGEYGWDHNTLYIFERAGQLFALIEWTEFDPLTEEGNDVFAFPAAAGMYHGEKLHFKRDAAGRATEVVAANVRFVRRRLDGESGQTFRITPQRPVAELRAEAAKLQPPTQPVGLRKPELVEIAEVEPAVRTELRYATANNFLGTPLYPPTAKPLLQRPAAGALARVQRALAPLGYGLLVYDAYRPWAVTKLFWEATPPPQRGFVADPAKGSKHNRGCAVDLTLCDLTTGKPVEMVSGYDEFSDRAFPDYPGGTSRQRWHRDLLRRAMEAEGFTVDASEWWHFDHQDWQQYPALNQGF
jgi:serine beta-lactamase-like protein LACTB